MWGIIVHKYDESDTRRMSIKVAIENVRERLLMMEGVYCVQPEDAMFLRAYLVFTPPDTVDYYNSLNVLDYVSIEPLSEEGKGLQSLDDFNLEVGKLAMLSCHPDRDPTLYSVKKIDAPKGKGRNENVCGAIKEMTEEESSRAQSFSGV